jgi:hypothetical protein
MRSIARQLAAAALTILSHSALFSHEAAAAPCVGDCDLDGAVTVNELIRGVNIALGTVGVDSCPPFDRDNSATVSVDEIVAAVQNALVGCPRDMTPSPSGGTPTAAPTSTPTMVAIPTATNTQVVAPTATPTRTPSLLPTATATAQPTVPSTPNFVVRGKVLQAASGGGGVSGAGGADVTGSIDRNGDGLIGAGESTKRTADSEGGYVLNLAVASGERVVLSFRTAGSAPLFRSVEASPGGDVVMNVTLRTAEELDCGQTRCALPGDRLTIEGLPPDVTGSALLFNPATQADAFPGDFADDQGNVLLSGAFASVELVNGFGQPVKQLAAPATLRMEIPRETWGIVADIIPGNGSIDVPLYAFDETRGEWTRDGGAVLEDAAGSVIPEGSLAGIRNGSFAGAVVARGQVGHFSYWNVDWPIETHGCSSGRFLDAGGQPAAGAAVTVRGTTYVGSSTATADADGRFCVDVLRSEGPGEDVDQDGVTGETQNVSIRVAYRGRIYDAGGLNVPTQPGTCDLGCGSLGEVRLTPDRELRPGLCTLDVIVRDRDGVPVAGASVFAGDDTVDPDVAADLCAGTPDGFCLSVGATDDAGRASVTAVLLDTLFIGAVSFMTEGETSLQRWGEATRGACPSLPVEITLTEGYRIFTLTVEVDPAGTISWTPTTYGVTVVSVLGTGTPKWIVVASVPGFDPPVAYGTVPTNALQIVPTGGGPPPGLSSGDFVSIGLTAPGDDGYAVIGQGFAIVP